MNWSRVCRHWGKAAIFRAHAEHGVEGLEEQAQHFWRYEGPAAQNVQDNQRSHQARTPKSRAAVPRSNKICFADFDPTPYGPEYIRLTEGDVIQDVEPPMAAEGWAYGSLVLADGGRSAPGWYPHSFAQ